MNKLQFLVLLIIAMPCTMIHTSSKDTPIEYSEDELQRCIDYKGPGSRTFANAVLAKEKASQLKASSEVTIVESTEASAVPIENRSILVATAYRSTDGLINKIITVKYSDGPFQATLKDHLTTKKIRLIQELIPLSTDSVRHEHIANFENHQNDNTISDSVLDKSLKLAQLIESLQRIQAFEEERS